MLGSQEAIDDAEGPQPHVRVDFGPPSKSAGGPQGTAASWALPSLQRQLRRLQLFLAASSVLNLVVLLAGMPDVGFTLLLSVTAASFLSLFGVVPRLAVPAVTSGEERPGAELPVWRVRVAPGGRDHGYAQLTRDDERVTSQIESCSPLSAPAISLLTAGPSELALSRRVYRCCAVVATCDLMTLAWWGVVLVCMLQEDTTDEAAGARDALPLLVAAGCALLGAHAGLAMRVAQDAAQVVQCLDATGTMVGWWTWLALGLALAMALLVTGCVAAFVLLVSGASDCITPILSMYHK